MITAYQADHILDPAWRSWLKTSGPTEMQRMEITAPTTSFPRTYEDPPN